MQDLKMSVKLLLIFMLMLVTLGSSIATLGHAEIVTPRLRGLGDNSESFQNNRSDDQVEIATQRSSPANVTAVDRFGNNETGETRRRHSVEDSISSNPVRLAVAIKALELENNQLKFTVKELQTTTEKFATRWQESNFAISQLTAVNQQQELAIGQLQLQVSQLSTNTMKLQDENEVLHDKLRSLQEDANSHYKQMQSQLLKVSDLTSGLVAENSSIYTQLLKVLELTSELQVENSSIYAQLLQVSNLTSELRAEDRSIYSQLWNISDVTTELYTENGSIYTQLQTLTTDVIAGQRREEAERLALLEKVGKLQTQSSYLESHLSKRSSALEERLTSQVTQLQQKDQELVQMIVKNTSADAIGFHARLSNSIDATTTGTLVVDRVEYNSGEGYNSATGIFTAPVTGFYLFLANMAADTSGKSAWIKIVLDQTEICKTWSRYSTEIEMASCHAATKVVKGQQVRVVMEGYSERKIRGNLWTTFTGVLIQREN